MEKLSVVYLLFLIAKVELINTKTMQMHMLVDVSTWPGCSPQAPSNANPGVALKEGVLWM